MSSAIHNYLDAYDEYQTCFALERLRGWNGDLASSPARLFRLHERMVEALAALYYSEGRTKPNYVERARERLRDETPRDT